MSVRELMNQKPGLTAGVMDGCILVAIVFIIYTFYAGGGSQVPGGTPAEKAFYSIDLGKTYFADSASLVPPFDHEGKQAVGAVVVRCGDNQPMVEYITRYSPDASSEMEKLKSEKPPNWEAEISRLSREGMEVAQPGGKQWVSMASPAASAIMAGKKCPDGKLPVEVTP